MLYNINNNIMLYIINILIKDCKQNINSNCFYNTRLEFIAFIKHIRSLLLSLFNICL